MNHYALILVLFGFPIIIKPIKPKILKNTPNKNNA